MNKVAIRLSIVTLLLIVLAVALPAVDAQGDAALLEFGKPVKGEITDAAFEVNYKFQGEAKDTVILKMVRDGFTGGLAQPDIILLDSANKIIADTTRVAEAILAVQLPEKGEYAVIATRRDGRAGKSIGKYILELIKPAKLTPDTAVKGKATYTLKTGEVQENFYLVEAEGPFKIAYEKQSGKFNPTVTVNLVDKNVLQSVGTVGGKELTDGVIGVGVAKPAAYIVRVGRGLFEFAEGDAEYTVTLIPKKS